MRGAPSCEAMSEHKRSEYQTLSYRLTEPHSESELRRHNGFGEAQYSEGSIMIQRVPSATSQMAISSNGKSV